MLLGFVLFFFSIGVEFEFKACFFLFSLFWVLSVSFLSEQGVAGQESDPYTHTESSLPWECEESEEWGVDVGMLLHSRQLFSLQGHLVNGISPLSIKFVKQIGYGSGSVWKVVFRCVCVCWYFGPSFYKAETVTSDHMTSDCWYTVAPRPLLGSGLWG